MGKEEYLSVTQAAERKGVTRSAIQQAIEGERLRALRVGSRYILKACDVDAYVVAPGGAGRKRQPKRQKEATT